MKHSNIPYEEKALDTFNEIIKGLKEYTPNTLYHNKKENKFFYINTKGYLHLYVASSKTVISDMMLTKENTFKAKDYILIIDENKRNAVAEMFQNAIDVPFNISRKEFVANNEVSHRKSKAELNDEKRRYDGLQYTYNGIKGNLSYLCYCFHKNHYKTYFMITEYNLSLNEAFNKLDEEENRYNGTQYTYKKNTGNLSWICKTENVDYYAVFDVIKSKNKTLEEAIDKIKSEERANKKVTSKIQSKSKQYTFNNEKGSLDYFCKKYKQSKYIIEKRLEHGMTLESALCEVKSTQNGCFKIYSIGKYKNDTDTLGALCDKYDKDFNLVLQKLSDGWGLEETFETIGFATERYNGKQYIYKNITGNINYLCKRCNINPSTVRNRIKNGMSIEDALEAPVRKKNKKEMER